MEWNITRWSLLTAGSCILHVVRLTLSDSVSNCRCRSRLNVFFRKIATTTAVGGSVDDASRLKPMDWYARVNLWAVVKRTTTF